MGEEKIRIFSIFTDTSLRVANFQPANDYDSSRTTSDRPEIGPMFPTLCQMPTIDLAARGLLATCDPREVQNVKRLMRFGRVGFSVMAETGEKPPTAEWMLRFAANKLTGINFNEIERKLYTPAAREEQKDHHRGLIALLGPRLAYQVGSLSVDATVFVASHMMYLEHVGEDHHQLFTRYLSEPILSEGSAQVTAKLGWVQPLDCLINKIEHGVVDGGFRGEFVTKALLCIACEDAQRASRNKSDTSDSTGMSDTPDSIEIPDTGNSTEISNSWIHSTPVTAQQFLNSLFTGPRIEDPSGHSDEPSAWNRKRKQDFDAGQNVNTTKEIDDCVPVESDTTEEIDDHVPVESDSFTDRFLRPKLESQMEHTWNKEEIDDFLGGIIFFNHWIRTEEVIRPSVLVKAWNRNAALMCKELATGIDFVIPVMRKWRPEFEAVQHRLGRCTQGKWDDDQQAAASEVISYILIQTKNRAESKPSMQLKDMMTAIPLCSKDFNTHPNFADHEPRHPFLSILFDFGKPPGEKPPIEMLWTVSERKKQHEAAVRNVVALRNPTRNVSMKVEDFQKAEKSEKAAETLLNTAKCQIPIVSIGLDSQAFKCLETRPRLTYKLNQLLTVCVDPLDKLSGVLKTVLLESRPCIVGEDLQAE
jgi:hypothetical protein